MKHGETWGQGSCFKKGDDVEMNSIFNEIIKGFNFSGNICSDSYSLLKKYNLVTAEHSQLVACEAKVLAKRFGVDVDMAEIAGALHDISGVYAVDRRLEVAKELNIEILKEEMEFPLLIHQKISKVMAQEIWGIKDREVLEAISCHTTLRSKPSKLDLVLFVADKIRWDQKGIPPYIKELEVGINHSLERGAYAYIAYLMKRKSQMQVIHPWLKEAYEYLEKYQ